MISPILHKLAGQPDYNNGRSEGPTKYHRKASTMHQEHRDTSADDILSAWQEGIAKAASNPVYKQQLLQKEAELLP